MKAYKDIAVKRALDDMYEGRYNGEKIRVKRVFRNHRLTDEECEALLSGEILQIHDLNRGGVEYAVKGSLFVQDFKDFDGTTIARFKDIKTISRDPGYRFEDRTPEFVGHEKEPEVDISASVGTEYMQGDYNYTVDDDGYISDEESAEIINSVAEEELKSMYDGLPEADLFIDDAA